MGGWASWEEIDQDGCELATRMAALGVAGPDRPVVVVGETSRQLVVAIRAVLESGAPLTVLAPVDRRRRAGGEGLARQVEGVAPCVVLFCDPVGEVSAGTAAAGAPSELPGRLLARLDALTVIEVPGNRKPGPRTERQSEWAERPGAGSPVLLQYTSGSTQVPRPVAVSRQNLMANIAAIVDRLGYDPANDRLLSWLPLYHDMGLIGFLLLAMLEGIDLVLADPGQFLRRPANWLRWISETRATATGAPQFAYSVTGRRQAELGDVDLSRLRVAINGAEQVDPEGVRRFLELAGRYGMPPRSMTCAYGLAEATLAVSVAGPGAGMVTDHVDADAIETTGQVIELRASGRLTAAGDPASGPMDENGGGVPGADLDRDPQRERSQPLDVVGEEVSGPHGRRAVELARLGAPLPGVQVRIVHGDRQPVDACHVGEIEVRGPSVTSGFWPLGQADRHPGDGWLATGDLGYLTADGELVVWGRSKDVIVIAGRNYSPVEIERVAATVSGIRAGNVAAFGVRNPSGGTEALVVVAETADQRAGLTQDVRAVVRDAFGLVPREVVLLAPGALPKTTSGKVRRSATRTLFETGAS